MSFVRPEASAALWRWREVLAGVVLAVIALWFLASARGVLTYLAPALLVVSGALIMVGLQRGRFRAPGGGLGAVQVDEGEITYFGPLAGGSVALRDLDRLVLDGRQHPPHWRFERRGHAPLMVPVNAEGAEELFDAFAALPGLRTERMLRHLDAPPETEAVIWERPAASLAQMAPRGRA